MLTSLRHRLSGPISHSPAPLTPVVRRPSARAARRTVAASLGVAAVTVGLTACTPTINVPAGVDAAEPICATVVLMLPDEVGGQSKVRASSQATAAWGEPGRAITLRCGVEPPAPTTQDCQSVDPGIPGLGTFDWITTQDDNGWTFTTYGREPAVSVQVPTELGGSQPTASLIDVARAVSEIPTTSHACR